MCNA